MSTSYPPPPSHPSKSTTIRQREKRKEDTDGTLYSQSPHQNEDHIFRKRRARVNCGLDPLHVVALIVLAGFILSVNPGILSYRTYIRPFQRRDNIQSRPDLIQEKMVWQKTFTLPSASKGCHLVTPSVEREISEGLRNVKAGLLTLFIQHTSAALSVNENYDSTVRTDMNMAMDRIVPESLPWKHTDEGPDDSASHTKASLFGSSITIPITDGRLNLGTWQGIYLCGMCTLILSASCLFAYHILLLIPQNSVLPNIADESLLQYCHKSIQ